MSTNSLSPTQIEQFYKDGYSGPFDSVLDLSEVDSISNKILTHSRNKHDKHPVYGRYSVRDWYLVYPELVRFVSHPTVLGQLRAIMGDHLILWRSNVFYKPPGTGPIGWHQDFGTFSGEDIGNNKPSLLPTHLKGVSEKTLKKYLPDTLALSSPHVAPDQSDFWNMTVWVALNDIDPTMGPLKILKGSYKKRYPVKMDILSKSDFWQNPFANVSNKSQLIELCRTSNLVLDIDTSRVLDGLELNQYTFQDLKDVIFDKLKKEKGSITEADDIDQSQVVTFPMKKGNYIIFTERLMHGSLANTSQRERLGINFRVTLSSTLVYPSRLKGDFWDGFNLDVNKHRSVLLSGENLNSDNAVVECDEMCFV